MATAIAYAVLLIALLVLLGWSIGSTRLTSGVPHWIAVQPMTAVGLIFGAIALAALAGDRPVPLRLASLALGLIGCGSLLSYALGIDLSLDLVMFRDAVLAQQPLPIEPGRSSIPTCLLFVALGVALPLAPLQSRFARAIAVALATLGVAVAGLALLATILLDGDPQQLLPKVLATGILSASSLAALCIGVLILRRDTGWVRSLSADDQSARLALRLLPIAITPVIAAFIADIGVRTHLYSRDVRMLLIVELSVIALLLLAFRTIQWVRGERAARDSLARALDLSSTFVRRLDGCIEHWPRGCEALYGWDAAQAVGSTSHDLLKTEFPESLEAIQAALQRNGEWAGELRHMTRRGTPLWVAAHWVLEGNLLDRTARVVETATDITELKRAADALHEIQDRLGQAVAGFELGLIEFDFTGTRYSFSAQMERIVGLRPGDLDIETWRTLIDPDDYAQARIDMASETAAGAAQASFSMRVHHADGSIRNLQGVRRYRYTEDGSPERGVAIFKDVTDQVRDRSEMEARGIRLLALQAELTHISRVSAMSELATDLAHELNQPLSATANFLASARMLIERGESGDRVLDLLRLGEEQTLRSGEIIRRLRDFLTKRDGDILAESLDHVVREAVDLVLFGAAQADTRLTYQLDPAADRIFVDRIQVQQVLVNLLRNAVDAMRDRAADSREIIIGSRPMEDDMVEISVADSGPGLPDELAEQLYSRFASTKGESSMGVGLSISRRIVEAHGGKLTAENRPEGGAIFRFTVPVPHPEQAEG